MILAYKQRGQLAERDLLKTMTQFLDFSFVFFPCQADIII